MTHFHITVQSTPPPSPKHLEYCTVYVSKTVQTQEVQHRTGTAFTGWGKWLPWQLQGGAGGWNCIYRVAQVAGTALHSGWHCITGLHRWLALHLQGGTRVGMGPQHVHSSSHISLTVATPDFVAMASWSKELLPLQEENLFSTRPHSAQARKSYHCYPLHTSSGCHLEVICLP